MNVIDGIPVFGTPDPGAWKQVQNALRHPGAVRGVLCADNHSGYAVPIGGVVAYRGAISPSGVGYDIACFAGSQKVALADGRSLSFEELVREHAVAAPWPEGWGDQAANVALAILRAQTARRKSAIGEERAIKGDDADTD